MLSKFVVAHRQLKGHTMLTWQEGYHDRKVVFPGWGLSIAPDSLTPAISPNVGNATAKKRPNCALFCFRLERGKRKSLTIQDTDKLLFFF